jgi:hypothetical protein
MQNAGVIFILVVEGTLIVFLPSLPQSQFLKVRPSAAALLYALSTRMWPPQPQKKPLFDDTLCSVQDYCLRVSAHGSDNIMLVCTYEYVHKCI